MQSKTKDTIIRHLKGIVAALEKDEEKEKKEPSEMATSEIQAELARLRHSANLDDSKRIGVLNIEMKRR